MIIFISSVFNITFLEFKNPLRLWGDVLVKSTKPFWSVIPLHNFLQFSRINILILFDLESFLQGVRFHLTD